ncbi:MAG TPA: poly(3-hydroxyalkanoate) depolymerase [Novosphingobium sp.]|nr:poly(3-hydroxyalkanoate) depolymerase [Novosphingobium sp.]
MSLDRAQGENVPANPVALAQATVGSLRISIQALGRQEVRVGIRPGKSGRTPLLIFNGIGARLELLAPLADEIDANREVIIFDIPGAGESPAPRLPFTLWEMARLTLLLLDRLGRDRVDVMGISWGGTLAQQFALQYPGRCRKLILAATTAGALMVPGNPLNLLRMATPRRYNDPGYWQANFGKLYGGAAHASSQLWCAFTEQSRPTSRRGYLYQQLALVGWTSLPFLPFLKNPTLILAGNDDRLVPLINARVMARLIPNSQLQIFEDGHLFIASKVEECAAAIDEFLFPN